MYRGYADFSISQRFYRTLIVISNLADADLVNKIMVSAFELAGHGLTAVDNILNNGNDNGNSDNVNNVVKWMFFKDDEQVTDTAMKSPRLKKVQGRHRPQRTNCWLH